MEDYAALCLLRARIEAGRAAGHDVRSAEEALEHAAALAIIPNAGGRYSSQILPNPAAVYQVRQEVAEAIESLGPRP